MTDDERNPRFHLGSSHGQRVNFAGDAGDERPGVAEVALGLDIQPETRRLAEIAAQAQRGVEGDRPPAVDDFMDPARRHAQGAGERVLGERQRLHVVFEEDFPGVRWSGCGFMVMDLTCKRAWASRKGAKAARFTVALRRAHDEGTPRSARVSRAGGACPELRRGVPPKTNFPAGSLPRA